MTVRARLPIASRGDDTRELGAPTGRRYYSTVSVRLIKSWFVAHRSTPRHERPAPSTRLGRRVDRRSRRSRSRIRIAALRTSSLTPLRIMLGQGFEPWSSARKANMIGRTTPTERCISDEEWPIDKSVFFRRGVDPARSRDVRELEASAAAVALGDRNCPAVNDSPAASQTRARPASFRDVNCQSVSRPKIPPRYPIQNAFRGRFGSGSTAVPLVSHPPSPTTRPCAVACACGQKVTGGRDGSGRRDLERRRHAVGGAMKLEFADGGRRG